MCVNAFAEPPTWLDDWYEIEVIIFMQPDAATQEVERATPVVYTEDLIVAAPELIENVRHAFPLTELERMRLRDRSNVVDLAVGNDPWFIPQEAANVNHTTETDQSDVTAFGTFPDWLLPPGESYDPLFVSAFEVVPFGEWFAFLSLASLIEKEDEENESHLDGNLDLNDSLIEESNEIPEQPEITRNEILAQIDAYREELIRSSYVMDEQNVRLPRTAARLRSKGVHVIKHFNWHQYVPPLSADPEYVLFQSLEEYQTEGYFGVSKGRFIHFNVHMWIHQPNESTEVRAPIFELMELRRMQREDVHYFDHPKFGILAEVVKVDLPPDLQSLWNSLD